MCRSRRELSNEYLLKKVLAKFGFDTAENEPCKVCPLCAYRSPRYWATYTLTGIGYGDITPKSAAEVSASTIFMLVGALLWACVLGTVLEAMTMFSEKQRQAQVTSDRLKQLVIRYQVPPELADRLSDYFDRFN